MMTAGWRQVEGTMGTKMTTGNRALEQRRQSDEASTSVQMQRRGNDFLARSNQPRPARAAAEELARTVEGIEKDSRFLFGYLVIKGLAEATRVTIEGGEGDKRATVLCDNLLQRWTESLPHALRAFAFGRVAFERTYRFDEAAGIHVVAHLDPLPFTATARATDAEGRFAGITLYHQGETMTLPVEQSWWCALDATVVEPEGRSRYLGAAVEVYRERRRLAEQRRIWLKKYALGHGIATAPTTYDNPMAPLAVSNQGSPEVADPLRDTESALAKLQSGGIVVLPSGNYPPEQGGGPLFSYTPAPPPRDHEAFVVRQRELDDAALEALGIPPRAISQLGTVGSQALAETHLEVLRANVDGLLNQIGASFQRYVVDKAVSLNHMADRPMALRLVIHRSDPQGRQQLFELAKMLLARDSPAPLVASAGVDVRQLLWLAGCPIGQVANTDPAA